MIRWRTSLLMSILLVWLLGCLAYARSPWGLLDDGGRVIGDLALAQWHADDRRQLDRTLLRFHIGQQLPSGETQVLVRRPGEQDPGLRIIAALGPVPPGTAVPFVYQDPQAAYLQAFRAEFQLDRLIAQAGSEYQAMVELGTWLGSRWDHGTDVVPGGREVCSPIAVVRAGSQGRRFWCDIAAHTAIHAATALGWQARLVTMSRNGHDWEHAVAELWSNQFRKWFVMDTDFNVVFERHGIPLSAFELAHQGDQLQRGGELTVRALGPAKPSLPYRDLLPFFAYVHIDLRNDWCSRSLPRGSPAGGDLATWYTTRSPFEPLLTVRPRVDDAERFDWNVNVAGLHIEELARAANHRMRLAVALSAYSPVFQGFEVSLDEAPWQSVQGAALQLTVEPGQHQLLARVRTSHWPGPVSGLRFEVGP